MITNTKFYKEHKEEIAAGLATGLTFGLATGLAFGLAAGLVFGLVSGLVFGLAAGLAFGLVSGLVFGLVSGLVVILVNFLEALPFINGLIPILILIGSIILLVELFFWLDKSKKPKGISSFKFTLKKKFEALCEVILGLSGIAQVYILIREGIKYITAEVITEIIKWVGYIGAGIIGLGIVIGLFYCWIKLNERKYK